MRAELLSRELQAALQLLNRQIQQNLELKQENEELTRLTFRDCMTGLFNNAFLMHKGPELIAQEKMNVSRSSEGKLIVAYIDVDGLKAVNDTLGHAAGDQLIQTVAGKLKQTFKRESDQYLIRKSGDEFVLILDNCTPDYLRSSLEKINKDTSFTFDNVHIQVHSSYGFAVHSGQSLDEMLAEADASLYLNKAVNKNAKISTVMTARPEALCPMPAPQPM
jgi:diguanylate cyclase (GGDEF)-like protein